MSRGTRLLLLAVLSAAVPAGMSSSASAATCSDYSNQAAAQNAGDTRDADGDGIYCESLPCPCSSGGGGNDDSSSDGPEDSGEAERQAAAERRAAAERKRKAAARRRATARRRALARKRAAERRERLARERLERGDWRVSRVVDGDTIRVRRTDGSASETVRLIGVDTPETKDPDVEVECGGPEATALTLALTFSAPTDANADGVIDTAGGTGAVVELQTDRSQGVRDAYGRALAYVDVVTDIPPSGDPDGYDIGKSLVVAGRSPVYVFDNKRFARQGQYETAEALAQSDKTGSWSACNGDFHSNGG